MVENIKISSEEGNDAVVKTRLDEAGLLIWFKCAAFRKESSTKFHNQHTDSISGGPMRQMQPVDGADTVTGASISGACLGGVVDTDNMCLRERVHGRRQRRHRFITDLSIALSVAFLMLLGFMSYLYSHQVTLGSLSSQQTDLFDMDIHRILDNGDNGDNSDNGSTDYSEYSCGDLYKHTDVSDRDARCQYAHECNYGQGVFFPAVFCHDAYTGRQICLFLSPLLLLLLITLFRMLGSTAEDFFSPSLEMFSVKMGLPPRFAGVSLLALGNGAADVSATVNAITIDPIRGYQLSLGALTGAAMFIGTVVAGTIIVTAEGVPCRGALVRDVIMMALTVLVVYFEFRDGAIGRGGIATFLVMYGVFVLVVLAADMYHRKVVQPRLQRARELRELERQREELRKAKAAAAAAALGEENDLDVSDTELQLSFIGKKRHPSITITTSTEQTVVPLHKKNRRLGKIMEALSNYGVQKEGSPDATSGWGIEEEDGTERLVVFHKRHGGLIRKVSNASIGSVQSTQHDGSEYHAMTDPIEIDGGYEYCTDGGVHGFVAEDWREAFFSSKQELIDHWKEFWDDIYHNEDNKLLDKFLLSLELPLTVLRKLTVPIPCEGYYCRPLVAISIMLSPLWFAFYCYIEYNSNIFVGDGLPYMIAYNVAAIIVGMIVLRFAPRSHGVMSQLFAVPIALYGFAMGATWIDFIADRLVKLLSFLGIILHIPAVIMGLTILAWGNSMADLSANVTMAKKGLANMAMTACFAGPVFNILFGLGAGFSTLLRRRGESIHYVKDFPRTAQVGFLFLVINCAAVLVSGLFLSKSWIPKRHGYTALGLYAIYILCAISAYYW